jgi:hypothetical protein
MGPLFSPLAGSVRSSHNAKARPKLADLKLLHFLRCEIFFLPVDTFATLAKFPFALLCPTHVSWELVMLGTDVGAPAETAHDAEGPQSGTCARH